MTDAPPPGGSEAERLAALAGYAVLDTPRERDFDDLVRLASELLGAPIAAVNLIAADRQWFKAEVGLGLREMPLDNSICARLLLTPGELVVPDLLEDRRFAGNPLVQSGPGLRFYAGALLQTPEGLPLGTLCVLDTEPRPQGLTEHQRFALGTLARQVMSQLELRRAVAERDRALAAQRSAAALNRQIVDSATDYAIIATDLEGRVTRWNRGAEQVLGWPEAAMLGQTTERLFTAEDRAAGQPQAGLGRALQAGRDSDERWQLRRDGRRFRAQGLVTPLRGAAGEPIGFVQMLQDRSGQHAAAAALDTVTERYRLAARATNDAIWDWDLQADTVLWNEALETAYGHAPEQVEATGAWWVAQVHPEDRARVHDTIHAVMDGAGDTWDAEYRFRRADGSYAEVLDRGSVLRGPDGTAVRMIGAMLDQSARKQAEAALRAGADRLRLATVAGGVGTFDYDIVTGSLDWDDRCRALFGLPPGAPVSYAGSFLAGLHPEDRAAAEAAVARALDPAGNGAFAVEYRTIGITDGTERWVAASGEASFQDGVPRRLLGMVVDISETKRAAAALHRLNQSLAAQVAERTRERDQIWQASKDMLCVASLAGVFVSLNPAWSSTLGWSDAELMAEPFLHFVHPDDLEATAAAGRGLAAGAPQLGFENRYRCRDGRYRWFSWNAVPRDGLIYATVRDITASKEAEAAKARLEEQLRQSQKMEAVGQLTGGLAHDFNNLLTGITGSLELLSARLAQGRFKDVDRYVHAAEGAAKRAAALTHRLLAFSRQQTLDPRATDANRLVAGMEELIRRTMGPAIAVEVVAAGGLWPTLVDPNQLDNALLNLCINARDAMPDGGRLTLETANTWLDARAARERDMPPGQYVVICVTDTGTGMPPEVIARAFEPFFTTKPLGQGTGLGLSMIYGFAKQSGGQVRIYSELGQGTTMRLYLPRHHGAAEAPEVAPELADAPRAAAGQTVLVVDDEATIRMLVTEVLEELGYAALEASDAAAGLGLLRSDARIDLLVTDVGLPGGMSGRQMADMARLGRPELKVLFITGYAENAVVGNGHLAPGMHVMTKPFAMEALASRIQELIAAP